jgi:lipase chaperone LimK
MKKNIVAIALALAFAVAVPATFTGCTTTSSGKKVLDPAAASKLAPILRTSVAGAVVYGYTKNPGSVAYISVVQSALQEFVLSTNMSPSALQAKIYALPVKELKTPEAQLIITPLLSAYAAFGQQYVQAGLEEQVGWKLLAQALVDGVSDGLQGIDQIKQGQGQ